MFDLAEAFKHAEVHYYLRKASGGLTFKTMKVGDLMLGRYDEEYEFECYDLNAKVPILRKKHNVDRNKINPS